MLNLGKRRAMQLDDLTEEWNWQLGCVAVRRSETQMDIVLVADHAGPFTHKVLEREDVEEVSRR